MFKGSWKTTSAGIMAVISGIVGLYFAFKTGNVNEGTLTAGLASIITGIGLVFSRDNNVSSEEVGAGSTNEVKPPTP